MDSNALARKMGWADIVAALPMPAAVVDQSGVVLMANRWVDVERGEALISPGEEFGKGLRLGIEGSSRWRVRPLAEDDSVLLAMAEREDVGDHLLRRFFSSGEELFVVYDQAGRIIESNEAWESMLGYSRDEVFGLDSWDLVPEEDLVARAAVEKDLRETGRSQPMWRMRASDGSYRTVQWTLHFDHAVGRCFGIGRDVSEGSRTVADLHRRVFTDELTGLANRGRLVAELERCVSQGHEPSLLFCDIDRFKLINDSLGHLAGDKVLLVLGRRMTAALGGGNRLVARFGGDEFAVLLPETSPEAAREVAAKVREVTSSPLVVADRQLHVSMSIGISSAGLSGSRSSAEQLLRHADIAVYEAKRRVRGSVVVFDETLQRDVNRRVDIEAGLRSALTNDDLVVHYQPVVALGEGTRVGYEALLRWRRDEQLLTAGSFIDVAGESGLMNEIGMVVRSDAFALAAALRHHGMDHWVSINVSPPELAVPDFVDRFAHHMELSGAAPEQLLVEITESAVLNRDMALTMLKRLRALGVRVGLDDFGTGFSSLAHLRELPIDVVKIDRSFVADIVTDSTTRAVTHSVIELCQALDLDVILEGVETEEQEAMLSELGGTLAQGWRYDRALPPSVLFQEPAQPTR